MFFKRDRDAQQVVPQAATVDVIEDKSIVKTLRVEKSVGSGDTPSYFGALKSAGFKNASIIGTGYARISEEAIHTFLNKRYMEQFQAVPKATLWYDEDKTRTRCFRLYVNGVQGDIYWDEQKVELYPGTPPKHVLDSAIRARKSGLKDLRVVTVTDTEDPLLIARAGDVILLIDWWDDDFTSDDILKLSTT